MTGKFEVGELLRLSDGGPDSLRVASEDAIIGPNGVVTHGFNPPRPGFWASYIFTILTREDCEWLAEKGYRVKLKTTDVEEVIRISETAERCGRASAVGASLSSWEERVRMFSSPVVPRVGDGVYGDGLVVFREGRHSPIWLPFECFTLDPGPPAEPVTDEVDAGTPLRELDEARAEVEKLTRERDHARDVANAAKGEIEMLRSKLAHEQHCARKARRERDEAQEAAEGYWLQLKAAKKPAPSLRGALVQDRITKEGPWVVVSEPVESDCNAGLGVRVYKGESGTLAGELAQAWEWAFPEALELYEPPAPKTHPLGSTKWRALAAAAGVLAVVVPAGLLALGVV